MSKPTEPVSIYLPTEGENCAIIAAAEQDPDAQPMTSDQLNNLVPLNIVQGRPRSGANKLLVSIRYSPEVIAFFKASGEGWQTRMDEALKEYVREQRSRNER